jgi:ABC-type arginine/histidine transport system permease subunit
LPTLTAAGPAVFHGYAIALSMLVKVAQESKKASLDLNIHLFTGFARTTPTDLQRCV